MSFVYVVICTSFRGMQCQRYKCWLINPSCLGQAHPNRPETGPGYKNTEPGSILTILCIPFMVCPLKRADTKSGKVI